MKLCTKCKRLLDESMFNKNKDSKDGLRSQCKDCNKEKQKICNRNNKEKRKKYYEKYWIEHKTEKKQYDKIYTLENKNKRKEYQIKNKDKINKQKQIRKTNNIHLILDERTAIRISSIISGKAKTSYMTEQYCGYTADELRRHIESQFTSGMNWNNYGTCWEIDHIIPRFKFYYEDYTDEQFQKCWALSNLRPLSVKENRSRDKS